MVLYLLEIKLSRPKSPPNSILPRTGLNTLATQINTESKSCNSSWKLNGMIYHGCTTEAIDGACICAVEIESTTKELTHWRRCWPQECLQDDEIDVE